MTSPARRRREVMGKSGYTHLFFLDEAVALAAGHRPCAQCRREAYDRFRNAWADGCGSKPLASIMDVRLHRERVDPGSGAQRRHTGYLDELPDGTCVFEPGTNYPVLVLGDYLLPCRPEGYGKALDRPRGVKAVVLTPKCLVAVLGAGYRPQLHPTAILADVQ